MAFAGVDPRSKKDVQKLFTQLRKVAPEVGKETRRRFKSAAQPTLADARSRQPERTGELRRKTRIRTSRGVVAIVSSARHGRISEFGGRHPVHGHRDRWVQQKAQPAVFPAVAEGRSRFIKEANVAVLTALKKAGFR
jgi:HK97 gp10 family phage protein